MTEQVDRLSRDPTPRDYLLVGAALTVFGVGLLFAVTATRAKASAPDALLGPVIALVALTGLVWLSMVVARNYAVLREVASARYYVDYLPENTPGAEWVERPARTFNNLLQVPILFYTVALCILSTGVVDGAQLTLAWIFVLARAVHAVIYIAWNHVPLRFTAWMAGCITLIVLWIRFAVASADLWL